MSDLDSAVSKTIEGAKWRDTVTVPIGGESKELTVRQLFDDEFYEVSDKLVWDELEEYTDAVPTELRDEYEELSSKDVAEDEDLSDEEQDRLDELEQQLEEETPRVFDVLSYETFKGLTTAAEYGVEPDQEDMEKALREKGAQIESDYGVQVRVPEDTKVYWNDQISTMIEKSTNFSTFIIGMKVLMATVGDEGNS